jgi:hypothetical protein
MAAPVVVTVLDVVLGRAVVVTHVPGNGTKGGCTFGVRSNQDVFKKMIRNPIVVVNESTESSAHTNALMPILSPLVHSVSCC